MQFSPYYDFGNGFDYGYSYDTFDNLAENAISTFLLAWFILSIPTIIAIVRYIFMSIGLYKIASRRNMKGAFLAFLPVANSYLLGSVYDDINRTMNNTTKTAMKLLVLKIVSFCVGIVLLPLAIISYFLAEYSSIGMVFTVIASLVSAVSFVISVVYYVYYYISVYGIYKEYAHDKAVPFIIISIIFLPIVALFIFLIRNNESGYELWQKQREQQFNVNDVKFEEEVTESAVEEVFTDVSEADEQEQTIIESDEQTFETDSNE